MGRKRGMGCVYLRGSIYWIKYSKMGKAYHESSRSTKESDAKAILKKRLGELAEGRFLGPSVDRVALDDICQDFLNDYQINGRRSINKARQSVDHLKAYFGQIKVNAITTDQIKTFMVHRQAQKASNAEINRELAALKRAFNLALQAEKIYRRPHIPMLKENNARQGFFEHGDYLAVRDALPEAIQPVFTFGYITGWRVSEILSLRWKQVDREAGTVRIDPGTTKGGEGRTVYLDGELKEVIEGQHQRRRLDCPYVFHRSGRPIKDFRGTWSKALKDTKLNGLLFHDLRRTAIRNMVRAGVPERVAMMISGHRTRSVFDRYNIVSDTDLKEAARKVEAHNKARTVTKSVTAIPLMARRAVAYDA